MHYLYPLVLLLLDFQLFLETKKVWIYLHFIFMEWTIVIYYISLWLIEKLNLCIHIEIIVEDLFMDSILSWKKESFYFTLIYARGLITVCPCLKISNTIRKNFLFKFKYLNIKESDIYIPFTTTAVLCIHTCRHVFQHLPMCRVLYSYSHSSYTYILFTISLWYFMSIFLVSSKSGILGKNFVNFSIYK